MFLRNGARAEGEDSGSCIGHCDDESDGARMQAEQSSQRACRLTGVELNYYFGISLPITLIAMGKKGLQRAFSLQHYCAKLN